MNDANDLIRGESPGATGEVYGTRPSFIDLWVIPRSYKCTQDENVTVDCGLQRDDYLPSVAEVTFMSK